MTAGLLYLRRAVSNLVKVRLSHRRLRRQPWTDRSVTFALVVEGTVAHPLRQGARPRTAIKRTKLPLVSVPRTVATLVQVVVLETHGPALNPVAPVTALLQRKALKFKVLQPLSCPHTAAPQGRTVAASKFVRLKWDMTEGKPLWEDRNRAHGAATPVVKGLTEKFAKVLNLTPVALLLQFRDNSLLSQSALTKVCANGTGLARRLKFINLSGLVKSLPTTQTIPALGKVIASPAPTLLVSRRQAVPNILTPLREQLVGSLTGVVERPHRKLVIKLAPQQPTRRSHGT